MKTLLFLLVAIIALTSTLAGFLMISDPGGGILQLPATLLEGTPFTDFVIPGLLLILVVGIFNLAAVFTNMARSSSRYNWAIAGGALLITWILVQVFLTQMFHWLHILFLAAGVLVILVAYQLKGKWAA